MKAQAKVWESILTDQSPARNYIVALVKLHHASRHHIYTW